MLKHARAIECPIRERPRSCDQPVGIDGSATIDGTSQQLNRIAIAATTLLMIIVFVVDVNVPLGFAAGVLYVGCMLTALLHNRPHFVIATAILSSVLTVIGYFVSPSIGTADWAVVANRGLALFAIWAVVILGIRSKSAGTRARASEQGVRAIVDTAVDAIISIDQRGIVQSFNSAAEHMFGYTQEEIVGANVNVLMPSPHREHHDNYIRRYLDTREPKIIGIGREVRARRKDGSLFPADVAVSRVDHIGMFTGIVRDISDRKRTEEQLRQADRLSSIGTLAAGLGHDMNNVLLPIRSRLDLIERNDLDGMLREQFTEIRKSTDYLQHLADGLHLLALDPEDASATQGTTELNEWWADVRSLLGRALPKHVRLSASLPSAIPKIPVPPHRLTQAILNLLVNAGKAVGADGKVRLTAEYDENAGVVCLRVSDNGCGMDEEVRSRAFEPFFTTKTRGLGTGLGLSLVHGVVQAAEGTAEIESAVGNGTTIILRFPAVAGAPDPVSEDHQGASAPRVLVAVDDPRIRSLVTNLLEMSGFEPVSSAADELIGVRACITDRANNRAAVDTCGPLTGDYCVILGKPASSDSRSCCIVVEDPNDFDALRAAIDGLTERIETA